MKHLLLTTIAAVLVVGCGESQSPEPPTAKAPDISIHDAAGDEGNIEAVKQHLAAGANVNAKEVEFGWTPLHLAALNGHKEIAELLIANGAEVNARDGSGETPLHGAARYGHKEIIELLIAKGAGVKRKDEVGSTPLHLAAEDGHKEIADLLIAKGAYLEAKNMYGDTPLHRAAEDGHKEIADLLIAKGADVNANNELDETPLDLAKGEIADLIRKHGGKAGLR
jgi:ankyrin repeat protein